MKRKILTAILTLSCVLALSACGQKKEEAPAAPLEETAEEAAVEETEEAAAEVSTLEPGFYYEILEEELEGITYTFTYYIQLYEDGSGRWSSQDMTPISYSENTISDEYGNSYSVDVTDNGFILNMGSDVTAEYTRLEGCLVEPQSYELSEADIVDGMFPVNINELSEENGEKYITADIFTVDTYDIVDVNTLKKGDGILVDSRLFLVDSLEKDKFVPGDIVINGGIEEGGTELVARDEDNCYVYHGMDDIVSYTYRFQTKLPLSEELSFSDNYAFNNVEGASLSDFLKAYEKESDDFYLYCTTITIEGGSVIEVNRRYVP